MKKTNFLVVFWLLLAIISFIIVATNLYSIFDSISYLLIPATDNDYQDSNSIIRQLIQGIPLTMIYGTAFYFSLKQGIKTYKE
ncbi:hypothetical protein BCR22_01270 [Enterococcus plantarum]|uniref:hypothetical protein n=1 Tax=Enterococcus TaxID=1350 RepID=UPI00084D2B9B|nr:hypothetical protein [Enterococcus plantarum]MBO0421845.1 hypothetical protein [Enterococcus plantarum]OEG21069.1 hypothetical protein BCR22_01270 [Enterococcus plantarum]